MEDIIISNFEIAFIPLIVLLLESILGILLFLGWFLGARRLNIQLHHWMVYSATSIHLFIWFLWMFPKSLASLPSALSNPLARILPLAHWTSGLIALSLSLLIAIIFLFNRDIPLALLRRVRPLMIITIISWLIAFILGFIIFINFRIKSIPEEPYYYTLFARVLLG